MVFAKKFYKSSITPKVALYYSCMILLKYVIFLQNKANLFSVNIPSCQCQTWCRNECYGQRKGPGSCSLTLHRAQLLTLSGRSPTKYPVKFSTLQVQIPLLQFNRITKYEIVTMYN